jgi:hypothetical protein
MASSFTTNLNLNKPADNDSGWSTSLRADLDAIDALAPVGGLAVAIAETSGGVSASLNVRVSAGKFRSASGALVTYAGTSSYGITTASTIYVWLTDAGVIASGGSFPTGVNIVPLAVVVAGATTITSITDARLSSASLGRPGSVQPATAVTSTPVTLSAANAFVTVNYSGAVALTLPAASAMAAGTSISVMDISGAANTYNITITAAGSDTINGASTKVISTAYGGAKLWCDGSSKWFVAP